MGPTTAYALDLKLVAIGLILISSAAGVSAPLLGRRRFGAFLRPDALPFAFAKAFAAGVVLATGFVHILPDAMDKLSSISGSLWSDFPFAGFTAMAAALGTLVLDVIGTRIYEQKGSSKEVQVGVRGDEDIDECDEDGDGVGIPIVEMRAHHAAEGHCRRGDDDGESLQSRYVVVSQILELGVVSHSIIIGLSLGVSQNASTIRPLIAALSFHQFFEGFALGGCISQAGFQNLKEILLACFFTITTPFGIATGAATASFYDPKSVTATVVEGLLDSVSAGILICMALVDLIAADFLEHHKSNDVSLQAGSYFALFLGAGFMSLLAIWS